MDEIIKRVIMGKAAKIYGYELQPRTDEEFLKRKARLDEQYAEAKKNYKLTSDEKYKTEMKKIKIRYKYNVSKTDYEISKKDYMDLREKYYDEADATFWIMVEGLNRINF